MQFANLILNHNYTNLFPSGTNRKQPTPTIILKSEFVVSLFGSFGCRWYLHQIEKGGEKQGWRSGSNTPFHQCGLGSNPGIEDIDLLELVVGSLLPPTKTQHFEIPIRWGMAGEEPLWGCATSESLFIYLFIRLHRETTSNIMIVSSTIVSITFLLTITNRAFNCCALSESENEGHLALLQM